MISMAKEKQPTVYFAPDVYKEMSEMKWILSRALHEEAIGIVRSEGRELVTMPDYLLAKRRVLKRLAEEVGA
jgi:hypothetical protein